MHHKENIQRWRRSETASLLLMRRTSSGEACTEAAEASARSITHSGPAADAVSASDRENKQEEAVRGESDSKPKCKRCYGVTEEVKRCCGSV